MSHRSIEMLSIISLCCCLSLSEANAEDTCTQDVPLDSVLILTEFQALDYLVESLMADSAYEDSFFETSLFIAEYEDSLTVPGDSSHYFNIAIREKHETGGPGDPLTAPIRDRFKVYTHGRIVYWSAIPGMYIPYDDFLRGITEL